MIGLTIVCLVTMDMSLRNGNPSCEGFIDEEVNSKFSLKKHKWLGVS